MEYASSVAERAARLSLGTGALDYISRNKTDYKKYRMLAEKLVKLPCDSIFDIIKYELCGEKLDKAFNAKFQGADVRTGLEPDHVTTSKGKELSSRGTCIAPWVEILCNARGVAVPDIDWQNIQREYLDAGMLLIRGCVNLEDILTKHIEQLVVKVGHRIGGFIPHKVLSSFKKDALSLQKEAAKILKHIPASTDLSKYIRSIVDGDPMSLFIMARRVRDDVDSDFNPSIDGGGSRVTIARVKSGVTTTEVNGWVFEVPIYHVIPGVIVDRVLYVLNSNPWTSEGEEELSTISNPPNGLFDKTVIVHSASPFHTSTMYYNFEDDIEKFGHDGSGLCASYAIAVAMVLKNNRSWLEKYAPDVALMCADYCVQRTPELLIDLLKIYFAMPGNLGQLLSKSYYVYLLNRYPLEEADKIKREAERCIKGLTFDKTSIKDRVSL